MAKINWLGITPKTDLGGVSSSMLVLNESVVEKPVLWPKHNPNIEQNDKEKEHQKIELPPLVSEVDVSRVVTAYKACKDGHCPKCPYQENHWGCEDNLADDIVKYLTCLMNENTELRKKVKEQEETIELYTEARIKRKEI